MIHGINPELLMACTEICLMMDKAFRQNLRYPIEGVTSTERQTPELVTSGVKIPELITSELELEPGKRNSDK
jgi:hypothetical protein